MALPSNASAPRAEAVPVFPMELYATCQGLVLILSNLLLIATIRYHTNLWLCKEYVVIVGVALTDCLFGMGSLAFAIDIVVSKTDVFTRHDCITTLAPNLTIYSMTAQAMMLVMQSVDRLLAIATPVRYYSFTVTYASRMVFSVFVYCTLQCALFLWTSWGSEDKIPSCGPKEALTESMFSFWNGSHLFYGCLSVVLYSIVMCMYESHINRVVPAGASKARREAQIKRQRKVTVSMGISCLFTLFLFVLPRCVNGVIQYELGMEGPLAKLTRAFAYLFYNVNPMLNLAIYMTRHREVRIGLLYMFKRNQLPPVENFANH